MNNYGVRINPTKSKILVEYSVCCCVIEIQQQILIASTFIERWSNQITLLHQVNDKWNVIEMPNAKTVFFSFHVGDVFGLVYLIPFYTISACRFLSTQQTLFFLRILEAISLIVILVTVCYLKFGLGVIYFDGAVDWFTVDFNKQRYTEFELIFEWIQCNALFAI